MYHLIHLHVNSLLPKIDGIHYIAHCTNVAVNGITGSQLDKPIFQSEIQTDNHDLLWCDRNINAGGVACYRERLFSECNRKHFLWNAIVQNHTYNDRICIGHLAKLTFSKF